MQISFLNYFLASIASYLGLLVGAILIKLAPEEQKSGRKYFIFLKMLLFFLIIALLLLSYKVNAIFSLALLIFIIILMLHGKLHLEKSSLVYLLFGIIFYLSSKNNNLFALQSALMFLYGIPNSSLVINPKKNNYREIFARNLWFFVPIMLLYWLKI